MSNLTTQHPAATAKNTLPTEQEIDTAARLAKMFFNSGMFDSVKSVAQAGVKILMGAEMGLQPMQAMMGIDVIKGRLSVKPNTLALLIKRHPSYDYRVDEHTEETCVIEFFGNGESIGLSSFSMDDARRAGIAGGSNWKNYPRNMLFARAMSNGVRWYCPDVILGPAYTADEIDDDYEHDEADFEVVAGDTQAEIVVEDATRTPAETEPLVLAE